VEAVSKIRLSDCLVTAPTGSGKTWIAMEAIRYFYQQGKKSWYASPLKALSNAKYSEFSKVFGADSVGILTGDRKENAEAPILVGTTEILRNQLYDAMHTGRDLSTDLVVLDEAHFLGDEDRGVVWEETIIYLPARIPLLLLSATIGNADQIAAWISSIRSKKCHVVKETRRPVPLYALFFHPSGTLYPLMEPDTSRPGKHRIDKKVRAYLSSKHPQPFAHSAGLPPFGDILRVLKKYYLLPAIFFLKSRSDCDTALERCFENRVEEDKKNRLRQRIDQLVEKYPQTAGHRQLYHLEHLAVGAHHAGQLPLWKLMLEKLMADGLLDAVFATSTVAAGVNFPARTVVFLNSDRFNGKEFMPLDPTQFHQMTGRAGRRGMDNIGFAVMFPGKYMDMRLCSKLIISSPSDVVSQIKINFSMVLNLLLSHSPDQIEQLLEKSFAAYLMTKDKRSMAGSSKNTVCRNTQLWRDFLRHLDFLKETGYALKSGELSEDGAWASQLRVDQPLLIAEGLRRGIFPASDPVLLAAVIASFVNEQETDERIEKKYSPQKLMVHFQRVKKGLKPFVELMIERGFAARPLFLRPAVAMHAWASGVSWENVVFLSGAAEGDFSMLVLRTADNLRHIRTLGHVFPATAKASEQAIDLILKDPVVMDYEG